MKLHRIRVENLNSLYGKHEVDLDEVLDGSSLFLIHGPTGSGKSTLMDAVSLALFGQTPRLDGSGTANPQFAMSRGTGISHASVEFSKWEGAQRERYRATWTTHRANQKSDGKFRPTQRSLEHWQQGEWKMLVSDHRKKFYKDVFDEVLEGFKVDDFNRSMLLAQGQFDAFLSAKPQQRAEILERLTETARFQDIGKNANRVHSFHKRRVADLTAQLRGEKGMTPEEKKELKARHKANQKSVAGLRERHEKLRGHRRWLEELQGHQTQRGIAAEKHEAALGALAEKEDDFARLLEHERCAQGGAFDALKGLQRSSAEAKVLQAESQELEATLPGLRKGEVRSQKALAAAALATEEAERRLHALRPLGERAAAAENAEVLARRSHDALAEEIERHRQALGAAEEKHGAAKTAHGDAVAALAEKKGSAPDVPPGLRRDWESLRDRLREQRQGIVLRQRQREELSALREATEVEAQGLRSEQEAAEAAQTNARSGLEVARTEASKALEALLRGASLGDSLREHRQGIAEAAATLQLFDAAELRAHAWAEAQGREGEAQGRLAEFEAPLGEAKRDAAEKDRILKEAAATVELAQRGLRRTEELAALVSQRHLLEAGEPCPLCGAEEHPYAGDVEDEPLLVAVKEAKADFEAAGRRHREAEQGAREAQGNAQRLLAQREAAAEVFAQAQKEADQKRGVLRQLLKAEQHGFDGPTQNASEVLEGIGKQSEALRKKVAEGEGQLARLEQAASDAEGAEQRWKQQLAADAEAMKALELRLAKAEAELELHRQNAAALEKAEAASATHISGLEEELRAFGAPKQQGAFAEMLDGWVRWGSEQVQAWQDWQRRLWDAEAALVLATQTLEAAASAATREQQALVASEGKQGRLQEQLELAQKKRSEALGELQRCWQSHGGEGEVPGAAALLEAEERRLRELKNEQRTAAAEAQDKREAHRGALVQESELRKRLDRAEGHWERASGELNQALRALGLTTAEELSARQLEVEHYQQLRVLRLELGKRRDEAAGALSVQRQDYEGHRKTLPKGLLHSLEGEQPFERKHLDEPDALEGLLHRFEQHQGLLQEELAVAEGNLRESTTALALQHKAEEQQATRRAELRQAEKDAQVWATLNKLIGVREGAVFREFAQALNLGQLLERANGHLSRLTDRYKLHPREVDGLPTLEFELADLWQAGVRVSVRSISGGERFLVSLALALGLSDFRSLRMPVETLLLDEGFGTLDKETLATALAALNQLQADGRQVGIISHVVGLAEAIPAQIQVVPTGGGRSRLEFR